MSETEQDVKTLTITFDISKVTAVSSAGVLAPLVSCFT